MDLLKIIVIEFIGLNTNTNALKCVSMSNQECVVRPAIMNIISNEPSFYSYGVLVNKYKCSGSCNDINNPYAKLCVSNVAKNMNIKVGLSATPPPPLPFYSILKALFVLKIFKFFS